MYRDRAERAERPKMDFYVKEVERIDHSRRASLEPSVVPGPPTGETEIPLSDPEGEDHSSARDVKRARGEPEQDLSGEMLVPGADETLTPAEIPAVPFGAIPSSSTSIPISPGASSSSGVKRAYSESTALPNSPGVSSGSGVKRAHGDSIVNDDEEQPGTRTRISPLIAGPHGKTTKFAAVMRSQMNGCPHGTLRLILSPKMVIEAKRKEMERFNRMKVYRVVTRVSMERDEEGKMISTLQTKAQKNIQLPRRARVQHWRQTWRVVCGNTRVDGDTNNDFQGDDEM